MQEALAQVEECMRRTACSKWVQLCQTATYSSLVSRSQTHSRLQLEIGTSSRREVGLGGMPGVDILPGIVVESRDKA